MASYTKMTVGKENRTELHEKLALTGAEISLNTLPAGANVPFVHSHKANEEIGPSPVCPSIIPAISTSARYITLSI